MKQYKKVELVAKNQVAGSYAAGCPSYERGRSCSIVMNMNGGCDNCERAQ
ncbi:MAG: hypothetical protein MR794_01575 [Bacteroidales bacterium]|nr:hypothetical protein [Bacteroidales bacterium]